MFTVVTTAHYDSKEYSQLITEVFQKLFAVKVDKVTASCAIPILWHCRA